jgi:hypothetical protein
MKHQTEHELIRWKYKCHRTEAAAQKAMHWSRLPTRELANLRL